LNENVVKSIQRRIVFLYGVANKSIIIIVVIFYILTT